jgi:hypothetical protein
MMSDVEQIVSKIEQLVQREPWRRGQGQSRNALDPTWSIARSVRCDGQIGYEPGSKWWFCKKCGFCGNHGYGHAHRAIHNPTVYLANSINDYLLQREREGVDAETAMEQMVHIAGVAIRYAAAKKSEDIGSYVQQLIVL